MMKKPIVKYRGNAVKVHDRYLLHPIDHPDDRLNRYGIALTSNVISVQGRRIETKNTIYVPEFA